MKAVGVLSRILTRTRESVAERRKQRPLDPAALVAQASGHRPFAPALSRAGPRQHHRRVQAAFAVTRHLA
jgi:hypothetical protein